MCITLAFIKTVVIMNTTLIGKGEKSMLVFIDESGHPHPNDSTQNPVLLAVCIHEDDIKSITNKIYKLKDQYYGKQSEIKSTKLIRKATIVNNRTNNKAYVEGMIDIVSSYDCAVFAVIMDKPSEEIVTPENHLPKQYYLLMKKIEYYSARHHLRKSMLIYDEIHEEADKKIAEATIGFFFKTKLGRTFNHILEMPLFVSSSVTPTIQFADIFAGVVRHYYEEKLDEHEPEDSFQEWISELFEKIVSLTENNKIPNKSFIEFGFQKMGDNFSYPVSDTIDNPA